MGIIFEAQQLRQFMAQRKNFFHHRAVIPLTGVRPLVGGASGIGAIHLFTQRLVVAVGHHWQIARDIQSQQVTFLLFGFRLGFSGGERAFRHSRQLGFVGDELRPAHGGIEHIIAVLVAQLRQASGDFAVTLLFLFRQANAGQFKITQRVIDRFLLRGIQSGVMIAVAQVAVRVVQSFMLANPGAVFRQQRQRLFVGFTQLRTIFHRV